MSLRSYAAPATLVALLAAMTACSPAAPLQTTTAPTSAPAAATDEGSRAIPLKKTFATNVDWVESAGDEGQLGIDVSKVNASGGLDVDGDGSIDLDADASVAAAGGTHHITYHEHDQPLMSDKPDVLSLKDDVSGDSETINANQEFDSFTVQSGASTVTLGVDATNSLTVNGTPAKNPAEAADLLAATPAVAGASTQNLAFLYGVLKRHKVEASRGEQGSQMGGGQGSYDLLAATPRATNTNNQLLAVVKRLLEKRNGK